MGGGLGIERVKVLDWVRVFAKLGVEVNTLGVDKEGEVYYL